MPTLEPSPGGDSAVLATVERRAYLRYMSNAVAYCREPDAQPEPPWRARVRDVSVQGMGLLSGRGLAAGTVLEVRLENAAGGEVVSMPALVRHGTRLPDGGWLLGCQFARQLTYAELEGLLGRRVMG